MCGHCWTAPSDPFTGAHDICSAKGCACAACATGREEVARTPLPRWTVDRFTTDRDALLSAMAFRKPNGDTVAVMRTALCPTCEEVAVLCLADGDIVSYVRKRHASCEATKES